MLEPASIKEFLEAVRGHDRVLAVGSRTKERLSEVDDTTLISTCRLTGITEYEPSEYTFTALAGTRIEQIQRALAEKGQFMPFDPLLRSSGATVGGVVASGLSGPGRFRYGGIRDFLLGIRYINGEGQFISAGGKVVKNAAGFDLPKFFVGSLGRFGALCELTFKVFPSPSDLLTLSVRCTDHQQAAQRLMQSASSRWEPMALDYQPASQRLYLQLGGPAAAIESAAEEIARKWQGDVERINPQDADRFWEEIRELQWVSGAGAVAIIPLTPALLPALQHTLDGIGGVRTHHSVGGNVAMIASDDPAAMNAISELLSERMLSGVVIQGRRAPLWIGVRPRRHIDKALKEALDPQHRFPTL